MKCTIPEISWHNRDPVLSVDIQNSSQSNNVYHLATGGTDHHVVIWQLSILDNGGVTVEMQSDLTRHNRAVNAVRFSPNGQILASSDDEAAIILWKKNEDSNDIPIFLDESELENKEHWTVLKMLRGHIEDVYDLCWSSCSQFLISGSVDNSAILWDVAKGKSMTILKEHKGFVQGVAWDPKGQLVATLSSDRVLRVFNVSTKKVTNTISKAVLPPSATTCEEDMQSSKVSRLFYDDTLKSFCRRLTFSPDGELLVAPSGILEDGDKKHTNVTHVFLRSSLNSPVMCFPTNDKYTIAVRFCPQIFELRKLKDGEAAEFVELFNLPYRMVFAVATQNSLLFYDTQQPIPFAKVSNIHYTRLTDISWSSDGRILIVSSTDGYCSLVSFAEGELGTPYNPPEAMQVETSGVADAIEKDSPHEEKEAPTVDKSGKGKSAKKLFSEEVTEKMETSDESLPKQKPSPETVNRIPVKRKPGKRVELITLSTKEDSSPASPNSKSIESTKRTPDKHTGKESDNAASEVIELESDNAASEATSAADSRPLLSAQKTPRRVSLITLSSPKAQKSD